MIEQIALILLAVSFNGILTVDGNDYQITSLDDSKIIAKGVAGNYPFACITNCWLVMDGDFVKADYREPEIKTNYNVPEEKTSNLELVVTSRNSFTQWWDEIFFHVNTKTQSDVNLKVYGSTGLVYDKTQKTNIYGFSGFSFLADQNFREGYYTYTVTAKDDLKTLTDDGSFYIIVKHNTG